MAIPIPAGNGGPVTFRVLSWADWAQRAWGPEWRKPDVAYVFSNGEKKDSTDQTTNGVYTR